MQLPPWLRPHTVTIEPVTGRSPYGNTYGAGVPVRCNWQGGVRLVRATDGTEVTASGTAYAALNPPGLPADLADARVTTPDGKVTYVIAVIRHDDGGLGGWQHTEIACQ